VEVINNLDAPAALSQEKPLRRLDGPRAESDGIMARGILASAGNQTPGVDLVTSQVRLLHILISVCVLCAMNIYVIFVCLLVGPHITVSTLLGTNTST
jgi:hypothetical protein